MVSFWGLKARSSGWRSLSRRLELRLSYLNFLKGWAKTVPHGCILSLFYKVPFEEQTGPHVTFRLLKAYPELCDLCVKFGGVIALRNSLSDTYLS